MQPKQLMKLCRANGLTKKIGAEEHYSPAFFLVGAADGLHSPNAQARQRARASFESLLTLAKDNGLQHVDELRQRLERGDFSERTFTLAKAGLNDVDPDSMVGALRGAGFDHPMLATGFVRAGSSAPSGLQ
jgi:hypothetical protein